MDHVTRKQVGTIFIYALMVNNCSYMLRTFSLVPYFVDDEWFLLCDYSPIILLLSLIILFRLLGKKMLWEPNQAGMNGNYGIKTASPGQ